MRDCDLIVLDEAVDAFIAKKAEIDTLIITDTGFVAIGIEVEHQKTKTQKSEPKTTPTERKIREGRNSAFSGTDPGVQRSRRS